MSSPLLESLSALITPDLVGKAASMLGESDTALNKGFGAVFPALLAGVANRAGDGTFASSLFNLVNEPANDGSLLNNVGSLLGASASSPMMALGGKLLGSLFGNNTGSLASTLSGYAGVKASTGNSLLHIAAPLVLAVLGRAVKSGALNASSLASLLLGQKGDFEAALPGPLANIGSFLVSPVSERETYAPPPVPERPATIWRWLLPLLIALGALWLLSSLFGRKERPVDEAPPPAAAVEPAPAVVEPAATIPTATVYFDVGQATLPAGGEAALASVIDYMKAIPGATAVISGYHDPTGDQTANEELAKNRAGAVQAALVAAGIDEARIAMQKPVVAAGGGSLEDARRVEVTVR
jgi:hypothetical protein